MNKILGDPRFCPGSPRKAQDPAQCGLPGLLLPPHPSPPHSIHSVLSALSPDPLNSHSLCPENDTLRKTLRLWVCLSPSHALQTPEPRLPGQRLHFLWIPPLLTPQACVRGSLAKARIPWLAPWGVLLLSREGPCGLHLSSWPCYRGQAVGTPPAGVEAETG